MNSLPLLNAAEMPPNQPTKFSHSVQNRLEIWESLKEEIRQIYIDQDNTLAMTMQSIEANHGLKARPVLTFCSYYIYQYADQP